MINLTAASFILLGGGFLLVAMNRWKTSPLAIVALAGMIITPLSWYHDAPSWILNLQTSLTCILVLIGFICFVLPRKWDKPWIQKTTKISWWLAVIVAYTLPLLGEGWTALAIFAVLLLLVVAIGVILMIVRLNRPQSVRVQEQHPQPQPAQHRQR